MRTVIIAICILPLISFSLLGYTYAQEESTDLVESTQQEVIESEPVQTENITSPTVSPFSILFSFIAIALFLSLGYTLIKRFNL
jgi:hypothetical protein